MKLGTQALAELCEELRSRRELGLKRDIQLPARVLGGAAESAWFPRAGRIANGDDTAAIPDDEGYLLFAAEGMRPEFVAADPWFAGYCSLMVNVSDVAAMGGRPCAVVDVLFMGEGDNEELLRGLRAAAETFGVPVVGGHTTRVAGPSALSVAIVGRARRLISSHHARPGQDILVAIDLQGAFRGNSNAFDAATTASAEQLRRKLAVLPALAESEAVPAGKDISMAGVCGSLLMLLETSGVGAELDLERLPAPAGVAPLAWLTAFPSFGFVLTAEAERSRAVCAAFAEVGVSCAVAGRIDGSRRLWLKAGRERALYADLATAPLTGFGVGP